MVCFWYIDSMFLKCMIAIAHVLWEVYWRKYKSRSTQQKIKCSTKEWNGSSKTRYLVWINIGSYEPQNVTEFLGKYIYNLNYVKSSISLNWVRSLHVFSSSTRLIHLAEGFINKKIRGRMPLFQKTNSDEERKKNNEDNCNLWFYYKWYPSTRLKVGHRGPSGVKLYFSSSLFSDYIPKRRLINHSGMGGRMGRRTNGNRSPQRWLPKSGVACKLSYTHTMPCLHQGFLAED